MARSIFDPDGGETERSGSRFGTEDPENRSHLPSEISDGKVSDEERAGAEDSIPTDGVEDNRKTNPDGQPRDEQRP